MSDIRPDRIHDGGMQQERTALAWERTAISMIVAGLLLARTGARLGTVFAAPGAGQVVLGAGLLVWAGRHYDELHRPLRAGESPVHPSAARVVGVATTVFSATALAIVVALAV